MKYHLVLLLAWAAPSWAGSVVDRALERMAGADVVILGEIHDNPDHHLRQGEIIARLAPAAVVYEMLTPEQAARVTPALARNTDRLADVLDWETSGWPDFDLYAPVFAAAPHAAVFGALIEREKARQAMRSGLRAAFGPQADDYGLTRPLDQDDQKTREELQSRAHCDALPDEMLAPMVDIQRLRDAELARAVVTALDATGGPVVLITGNGHARQDWGVPVYLDLVRPDLTVFALGQDEGGGEDAARFDLVLSAPPAERDDPCDAFKQ